MTAGDDCPFCKIASGVFACHGIFEDNEVLAFLVKNPVRPGHALVIPKAHFAYFDDMPSALAARTIAVGQLLAHRMKAVFGVERVGFQYSGGDLPHAHAHVIPLHDKTDLTSRMYIVETQLTFRDCPAATANELREVANKLRL